MATSFEPALCSFSVGWLRWDSDNENSTVTFHGDGTCCVNGMTLNVTETDNGMVQMLLVINAGGRRRLWAHAFSAREPLEVLSWVRSCMERAGEADRANRFMEYCMDERRSHERKGRGMVTSMSMLDFLQKVADSQRLTKDRFGEIMHGDYSEDERQRALEQMEMAGGYDNLADD